MEMILLSCCVDKSWCLLSAIVLKQCLVPRALRRGVFFIKALTASADDGLVILSVLYVRLPAQFFNFSEGIQPFNGRIIGAAARVDERRRKDFLFILHVVELKVTDLEKQFLHSFYLSPSDWLITQDS